MVDEVPKNERLKNAQTLRNRGLSSGIPKPNIVRIELLDGIARQRYLGGLQRSGDSLRTNLYDNLTENNINKIYQELSIRICQLSMKEPH